MDRAIVKKTLLIRSHHHLYKLLMGNLEYLKEFKTYMDIHYACFCRKDQEQKALEIYKSLDKLGKETIDKLKIYLKCDYIYIYLNDEYLFNL